MSISKFNFLEKKISEFVSEVGNKKLNEEQTRIYNAFVFQRSKPYKFSVHDRYRNTIRFTLYTNKKDDGVIHILSKHYKEKVGNVTAIEILNFCNVIRKGNISINNNNITYKLIQGENMYILTVALKKTNTEENILKSFYSNKTL